MVQMLTRAAIYRKTVRVRVTWLGEENRLLTLTVVNTTAVRGPRLGVATPMILTATMAMIAVSFIDH